MRKINFIIILLLSSICCFGQAASASSINRRATLFLNKRVGIKDYKIGKPDYTCIKMKDSISSFFLGKVDTVSIDKVTIGYFKDQPIWEVKSGGTYYLIGFESGQLVSKEGL